MTFHLAASAETASGARARAATLRRELQTERA
jgi:hypothetical protein